MLVLGSSGMLGSTVLRTLSLSLRNVEGIARASHPIVFESKALFSNWVESSAMTHDDVVVNCIGWIPQKATGSEEVDVRNANFANVDVPHILEKSSRQLGFRVIQIATDCVFTGREAIRDESSRRLATDLYGTTKIKGENQSPSAMLIRTSIVGVSSSNGTSLLDWLLAHPTRAVVSGYIDQLWNGVTTLAFSRLVSGIIQQGAFNPGKFHWVPRNSLSKFELLVSAANLAEREDLVINPVSSGNPKDMRLNTKFPDFNDKMWTLAGYTAPQTIESLLADYFLQIGEN